MLLWVSLLCLLSGATSQFIYDCSREWQSFNRKCYHFVFYPVVRYQEAKDLCAADGAILLSIESRAEHDFVSSWLMRNDAGQRNEWYTSGKVDTETANERTFIWEGTGSRIEGDEYWTFPIERNKTGSNIVYKHEGAIYGWVRRTAVEQLPYICEIPQEESYRILEEDRDFSYGVYESDPNLIPRGPEFVIHPQDTVVLLADIKYVFLECMANGYPQPTYKWMKDETQITSQMDTRYTFTNGRLTFHFPTDTDDAGSYSCIVENYSGRIRSAPAELSFATIGEFSNVDLASVHPKEYEGAVIECPIIPTNFETAVRYQWMKLTDSTNEFIQPSLNKYIFISGNGKLYFSEVSRSDEGTYHCLATLTSPSGTQNYKGASQTPSRTSKGVDLIVQNQVGGVYDPTIQDSFINVVPGQPLAGGIINMECFAYGTGPLIYVWQSSIKMDSRFSFSDSKRVLTITDLRLEDSGLYMCNVTGKSRGVDSKSYYLNVEAKPFFTLGLKNQFVDENKPLTWRCGATAKPSPTFRWFKNGQQLGNDTATGLTVNDNSMVIRAVNAQQHNGMYQCSARNKYGTTMSSAQLKVMSIKPNFLKNPLESSMMVTRGGNATFLCSPEAAPMPVYTWLHNGGNMNLNPQDTTSRVRMLRNGNLLLTNIQQSDQGRYTCKAENDLGSAESSGILMVLAGTQIFTAPSNTQVHINDTAFLFCDASYNQQLDMVYEWRFNGHTINMKNPHYTRGSGDRMGGLYIRDVQYKHDGTYTCHAKTQVDFSERSAVLSVYGPPGEPGGVAVVVQDQNPAGQRSVRIRWWDGFTHGSPITSYIVEAMSNYSMKWVTVKSNIQYSMTVQDGFPDQRFTVIENLRSGTSYKFRVRGVNRYGIGEHSYETDYVTIPGAPPDKVPEEVGGGHGMVGTLRLTWKPLAPENTNGWGIGYVVHWRRRTPSSDSKWNEITLHGNTSRITTVVGDENYYLQYEVRVQPFNMFGLGNISHIAVVFSAEGLPVGTPGNVYAEGYNSTALTVRWNTVADNREHMKGRLRGYKVNYWMDGIEVEVQAKQAIFHGQMDHAQIIGLQPDTWYWVNAMVYNSAGNGPRSEFFRQRTDMKPPQLYPTEVYVHSNGYDSVRVTFRGVSTYANEEPLLGYKIRWWQVSDNIKNAKDVDVRKATEGSIYGVKKGAVYTLRVLGYSRGGDGKMSSPETIFTLEGQIRLDPSTSEIKMGAPRMQSAFTLLILTLFTCIYAML